MFLINWGEITGRIDPSSFRKFRAFQSDKFPIAKMGEVVEINPSVSFLDIDKDTDVSFIPMERIDENFGELKQTTTKKIGDSAGFTRFEEGDLLWAKITPCMQNGKSAVAKNLVNDLGCGSTEFFVIRPKDNTILIEYIHFILRDERVLHFAQNYFGGAAGQQRVSKDFLLYLPIPIPDMSTQQTIVSIMNEAYEQKKKKVQEADELLKSINDYILDVLGICLPTKEQDGLNDRIFYIKSNDVLGQRLDPAYHMKKYVDFIHSVELGKYQTKKLNHFIKQITYGASVDNHYAEEGIPLLRIKDLCPNEIIGDDIVYLPRSFENKVASSRVNEGDILISRSGTIGVCSVVNRQFDGYAFGSFMIKVSVENIEPKYISYILNSPIGAIFFERNRIGAIQGNITIPVIQSVPIPVPNSSVQREIIEHIDSIRDRVNHLKNEAENSVENAKIEVERILLGDK